MFRVNDYVVYGSTGVCRIADIKKDASSYDAETEYYVLTPVFENNMTIMIPVNRPNLAMRAVNTSEEVMSLIAAMPEIEAAWIQDEKERSAYFKDALRSGKQKEWVKIIKTINLEKEARAAAGRKMAKNDDAIFKTAEKCLNQEFAFALNIQPDEVPAYILEHLPA